MRPRHGRQVIIASFAKTSLRRTVLQRSMPKRRRQSNFTGNRLSGLNSCLVAQNIAADLTRYCADIGEDPDTLHVNATAAHYNASLRWTLDHHPRLRFGSALDLYWRILMM